MNSERAKNEEREREGEASLFHNKQVSFLFGDSAAQLEWYIQTPQLSLFLIPFLSLYLFQPFFFYLSLPLSIPFPLIFSVPLSLPLSSLSISSLLHSLPPFTTSLCIYLSLSLPSLLLIFIFSSFFSALASLGFLYLFSFSSLDGFNSSHPLELRMVLQQFYPCLFPF